MLPQHYITSETQKYFIFSEKHHKIVIIPQYHYKLMPSLTKLFCDICRLYD